MIALAGYAPQPPVEKASCEELLTAMQGTWQNMDVATEFYVVINRTVTRIRQQTGDVAEFQNILRPDFANNCLQWGVKGKFVMQVHEVNYTRLSEVSWSAPTGAPPVPSLPGIRTKCWRWRRNDNVDLATVGSAAGPRPIVLSPTATALLSQVQLATATQQLQSQQPGMVMLPQQQPLAAAALLHQMPRETTLPLQQGSSVTAPPLQQPPYSTTPKPKPPPLQQPPPPPPPLQQPLPLQQPTFATTPKVPQLGTALAPSPQQLTPGTKASPAGSPHLPVQHDQQVLPPPAIQPLEGPLRSAVREDEDMVTAAIQGRWMNWENVNEVYHVRGLTVVRTRMESGDSHTFHLRWNAVQHRMEWGVGKYVLQPPSSAPMLGAVRKPEAREFKLVWEAMDGSGKDFSWHRLPDLPCAVSPCGLRGSATGAATAEGAVKVVPAKPLPMMPPPGSAAKAAAGTPGPRPPKPPSPHLGAVQSQREQLQTLAREEWDRTLQHMQQQLQQQEQQQVGVQRQVDLQQYLLQAASQREQQRSVPPHQINGNVSGRVRSGPY